MQWILIILNYLFTLDLEGVVVEDRLVVGGGHVVLSCPGGVPAKVEWRCRGCFSISETKETIVAELVKSRYIRKHDTPAQPRYIRKHDTPAKPRYIRKHDTPAQPMYIHKHDTPAQPRYIHKHDFPS